MKKYKELEANNEIIFDSAVAYYSTPTSDISNVGLQIVHDARKGINVGYFMKLGESMGLSMSDMSKILNVSLRTLQRYEPTMVLDADSSSKILNLTLLNNRGLDVFGDQSSFNIWLKTSVPELEGSTPLSLLDTSFGYYILYQVLGRIEHGIFA